MGRHIPYRRDNPAEPRDVVQALTDRCHHDVAAGGTDILHHDSRLDAAADTDIVDTLKDDSEDLLF